MDEKELQEYKQKIKGLSLKDLNDILSHINKEKVPEKYSAVEVEIASRTGTSVPKQEEPAPVAKPKEETAALAPKQEKAPETPPAPSASPGAKPPGVQLRRSKVSFTQAPEEKPKPAAPAAGPAKPASVSPEPVEKAAAALRAKASEGTAKKPLNLVLTAISILFAIAGVYFLLIPFVPLPGAAAIKAFLVKIPPHF